MFWFAVFLNKKPRYLNLLRLLAVLDIVLFGFPAGDSHVDDDDDVKRKYIHAATARLLRLNDHNHQVKFCLVWCVTGVFVLP